MNIYGKNFSVRALRKHIGHMDQVAGVRLAQLDDGRGRPARAALFHTGAGLQFTVLLDRGMDISSASFQGRAMGWRSVVGDVAPQYFEPEGVRWLRSYSGGLVTTCGLTHVGGPDPDSAETGEGLHGRISHLPAENVAVRQEWVKNDYVLRVTGTMRQAAVFGEHLTLTRTVWTRLGEKRFWIEDTVTNEGFSKTPLMLLYHCNIGWPAVGEGAEVLAPSRRVAPRDADAEDGKERWNKAEPPTHNWAEKVYYHDLQPGRKGQVTVGVVNKGFSRGEGFGVYITYNKKQLPRFVQWKQMGEQDYVMGLEPCNCGVEGPAADRAAGLLHHLRAGESRRFDLEFGAVTTRGEQAALRKAIGRTEPEFVDDYRVFVPKP